MAITQLKMEDDYILCNVIETFSQRKVIRAERSFCPLQAPNDIGIAM